MQKPQFVRIDINRFRHVININSIEHVEYIPPNPNVPNSEAEIIIKTFGKDITNALVFYGDEAEALWRVISVQALNITPLLEPD